MIDVATREGGAALVMVGKRKSSVPSPPPVVPPAPPSTRNKVAVYKGLDRVFPTHGVRVTRGVLDANDIKHAARVKHPQLCLSLVTEARSLDLQAETETDYRAWHRAMQHLVRHARQGIAAAELSATDPPPPPPSTAPAPESTSPISPSPMDASLPMPSDNEAASPEMLEPYPPSTKQEVRHLNGRPLPTQQQHRPRPPAVPLSATPAQRTSPPWSNNASFRPPALAFSNTPLGQTGHVALEVQTPANVRLLRRR
ncbi:hypothetical protein PPROV_001083900 [Pycnococcus provasolii]|uniref:Uncharacterized protein n=1 Tax=Pycnococcus provasolii TaxID=41880 RepID=A0A830HXY5_9CHLO|nr:hypothetical protein PPROV_001083900 [Pycnococcus provasolii]